MAETTQQRFPFCEYLMLSHLFIFLFWLAEPNLLMLDASASKTSVGFWSTIWHWQNLHPLYTILTYLPHHILPFLKSSLALQYTAMVKLTSLPTFHCCSHSIIQSFFSSDSILWYLILTFKNLFKVWRSRLRTMASLKAQWRKTCCKLYALFSLALQVCSHSDGLDKRM